MNYKLEYLNSNLEIINPKIEIVGLSVGNPDIKNINFLNKKYSVNIILTTDTAVFGVLLNDVQATSLDWTSGQNLPEQVLKALNEQFGV